MHAADGLIAVPSAHAPKETLDRLEAVLKQKGLTIFLRLDHAAGAPSCPAAANLRKTLEGFAQAAAKP